jgi:D-alanyl-D-alanine carboxypeptidase (penicillin-binding protein 5/6)
MRFVASFIAVCLLIAPTGAWAQSYFSTGATHAIIVDHETGNVLFAKNADEPIPPASMSKLMTVAVVLDLIAKGDLTPDSKFRVSEKAWRTGGSKMFVLVDTEIRVEDLLKGVLVHSGNDAAVVIAENVAGSEEAFAAIMNERAREWGLTASSFQNPMGLPDPNQRMSVADIARLARLMWDRFPDYRYLYGIREFTWSDITQGNRNPLLRTFPGADGMKTGHTDESGYGVVGTAERNGQRRFIVVAGLEDERSRAREADRIMGLAFSEFDKRTFFEPGDLVGEAEVFGGLVETVPLTILAPVGFTRHKEELAGAEAKLIYDRPLPAPMRKGEQVAILEISMPNHPTEQYPLYTAERVRELGVVAKMGLGLRILFTPPDADLEE